MKKTILAIASAVFLFTACGKKTTPENTQSEIAAPATEATTPATSESSKNVLVTLNAGDDMKYDLSEIKVKSNTKLPCV